MKPTEDKAGRSEVVAVRVPGWMKREIVSLARQDKRPEAEYVRELFRSHIQGKRASDHRNEKSAI